MSKRNFRNERYTVDDAKKGVTKKSASKAKVAREAASTVYVKDTSKVKKSKKQLRYEEKVKEQKRKAAEERRYNRVVGPGMMETIGTKDQTKSKKYRRYWWIFLIAAAICAVGAYFTQGTPFFYVLMVASYALIIVAIVTEFWKIRKARNEEESRSDQKLSTKRIKHEIEEKKQQEDSKMLKRFKKRDDLADELPFQE